MRNPPPWISTITGSPGPAWAGMYMFSVRQSSLLTTEDVEPGGNGGCGQFGPACMACNVVVQGVTGAGGRQRKAPIGGAANGTPRYVVTPFVTRPQIGPSSVFTRVPSE